MTQTLAVNKNNDLYIGRDGNLVIFFGLDAVLQACEHAVKAQLGEMVLATDQGIPNFQLIWNGTPNLIQWEAALRRAISQVSDVIEVVSLVATQDGNVLNYTATIRTIYGEGSISG